MNKKVILYSILGILFFVSCKPAVEGEYDSRAVDSLDKLSEVIGNLSSLSYTVTSYSVDKDSVAMSILSDVYLRGSNKMFIENSGTKGNRSFWYDGTKFSYFLFDKNEYDILDAPDGTLKLIDSIHSKFGIYFPAADFLYPTLTDDILENYDSLLYADNEKMEGIDCVLLEANNVENTVQVWIDKNLNLPVKMVITSKTDETIYYEAVYSNWKLNPELPDIMFEFQPPSGSTQVKFQPIKE